jgi:hypothetical protein
MGGTSIGLLIPLFSFLCDYAPIVVAWFVSPFVLQFYDLTILVDYFSSEFKGTLFQHWGDTRLDDSYMRVLLLHDEN